MTMLSTEPAICKKCGSNQYYTKVITWNTDINPEYPAHNKCYKCGTEIKYEDIDMTKCSPDHRYEVRDHKIYERFYSEEIKNDKNTEKIICSKCGSNKILYGSYYVALPEEYKDKDNYCVTKTCYECKECGHIRYETIEEILSCGLYEFIENGKEEHEYIVKYVDNYQEIIDNLDKQRKEELEQIENELIFEGLITTREEEKEYSDRYYKELDKKYEQLRKGYVGDV